mgnify:CR=1 FL=1
MKRILLAYTLSALCLLPAFAGGGEGSLPISYVNPFIGTTNFGTTNPGAVCPLSLIHI